MFKFWNGLKVCFCVIIFYWYIEFVICFGKNILYWKFNDRNEVIGFDF